MIPSTRAELIREIERLGNFQTLLKLYGVAPLLAVFTIEELCRTAHDHADNDVRTYYRRRRQLTALVCAIPPPPTDSRCLS